MIHKLEDKFEGKGEVKGFVFTKKIEFDLGYVFEVKHTETNSLHFEAILRKSSPVCIDFDNRVYSDTEFKEVYPKSKDFGVSAWTCASLADGIRKLADAKYKSDKS